MRVDDSMLCARRATLTASDAHPAQHVVVWPVEALPPLLEEFRPRFLEWRL